MFCVGNNIKSLIVLFALTHFLLINTFVLDSDALSSGLEQIISDESGRSNHTVEAHAVKHNYNNKPVKKPIVVTPNDNLHPEVAPQEQSSQGTSKPTSGGDSVVSPSENPNSKPVNAVDSIVASINNLQQALAGSVYLDENECATNKSIVDTLSVVGQSVQALEGLSSKIVLDKSVYKNCLSNPNELCKLTGGQISDLNKFANAQEQIIFNLNALLSKLIVDYSLDAPVIQSSSSIKIVTNWDQSNVVKAIDLVEVALGNFSKDEFEICHTLSRGQASNLYNDAKDTLSSLPWGNVLLNYFEELKAEPCSIDPSRIKLGSFFSEISSWLDSNPNEVVTIYLDDFAVQNKDKYLEVMRDLLKSAGLIDKIYIYKKGNKWPLVKDMIRQNKRVVLFAGSGAWENVGILNKSDIGFGSYYEYKSVAALDDNTDDPNIDWGTQNLADKDNAIFIIDNYITPLIAGSSVESDRINNTTQVKTRIENYEKLAQALVSLVMVDFYEKPSNELGVPDIIEVVNSINNSRLKNAGVEAVLDMPFNKVLFAMTHNSTSLMSDKYSANANFIKQVINAINKLPISNKDKIKAFLSVLVSLLNGNLTADQNYGVKKQLGSGIRGFKVPVHIVCGISGNLLNAISNLLSKIRILLIGEIVGFAISLSISLASLIKKIVEKLSSNKDLEKDIDDLLDDVKQEYKGKEVTELDIEEFYLKERGSLEKQIESLENKETLSNEETKLLEDAKAKLVTLENGKKIFDSLSSGEKQAKLSDLSINPIKSEGLGQFEGSNLSLSSLAKSMDANDLVGKMQSIAKQLQQIKIDNDGVVKVADIRSILNDSFSGINLDENFIDGWNALRMDLLSDSYDNVGVSLPEITPDGSVRMPESIITE